MADRTSIEWTDATWTPVKGCTRKSPGCVNCYAEIMAARFSKPGQWGEGLARIVDTPQGKDHRWTGVVRFDERELLKPLSWRRPRKIFVCSTSDLFQDGVTDEQIDRVFAIMALCPQHTFQVLTKRPERMRAYAIAFADRPEAFGEALAAVVRAAGIERQVGLDTIDAMSWPLPNVWLGTSVEDQQRANERIPHLLATPAAVRLLSCEPLLGPVRIRDHWLIHHHPGDAAIDWIIVGGESGPGARPMHPDWARSLRDQCAAAGVSFLFKQWGEFEIAIDRERDDPDWRADYGGVLADHGNTQWLNVEGGRGFHGERFHVMRRVGKKAAGRLLDGVVHNGFPAGGMAA